MKIQDNSIRQMKTASSLGVLCLKWQKLSCYSALALLLLVIIQVGACAQFAKPLLPNGIDSPSGEQAFGRSRVIPAVVSSEQSQIAGDGLNSSIFPSGINPGRTTVYVFASKKKDSLVRALRYMVLTIRPSTLNAEQVNDINDILGINMLSGQRTIEADASQHQLELIQSILAPSANDLGLQIAILNHGRKEINKDPNAEQWSALRRPTDDPVYTYNGPVPAAKKFARLFVIIGLVAATIYVAFAAYSIITGQAHGGNRVIAAASGLMLLLMGYTIYKILIMNATFRDSGKDAITVSTRLPVHGLTNPNFRQVADTPEIPLVKNSYVPRSNLPVQPFAGGR
jgi:hypothetical protein